MCIRDRDKADTIIVDAAEKARELGNERVMNVILLGSTVKLMNLQEIDWDKIIEENVKSQFVEINKRALQAGMDLV